LEQAGNLEHYTPCPLPVELAVKAELLYPASVAVKEKKDYNTVTRMYIIGGEGNLHTPYLAILNWRRKHFLFNCIISDVF
jgi:hypothetical protein